MTKNINRQLLLKLGIACASVILLFFLFIQSGISQVFRTMLYTFLAYSSSFEVDGQVYHETQINLEALKLLLISLFIFMIVVIAISSYFISKSSINKEVKQLTTKIPVYLTTDTAPSTGDLGLDNELLKIKSANMKNEELLKRETQRTKDLITYLAHDLKTPLASVIGYLNLLIDSPDLSMAQRAKFLQITLDKAGRLEELINEFFDITRFSLQDIHLNKTKMDLVLLTQQMIEEFYPLLSEKEQKIEYSGPDSLIGEADGDQLARVLNNLFKNALSYGNQGSTIKISLVESIKTIQLSVVNEGPTISARQLELIFDKFYRLDHARSTKTGGAGLGLAIAKEIVQAHDGEIHAQSKDGVTTFEVILPKS
ncbi:sensor histidine kinase [Enterococcus sp. LJL128]